MIRIRQWFGKVFGGGHEEVTIGDSLTLRDQAALSVFAMLLERSAKEAGSSTAEWEKIVARASGSAWAAANEFVRRKPS